MGLSSGDGAAPTWIVDGLSTIGETT
jgi:hypothetical protein